MPCAVTNNDFGTGTSPVIADGKVVLLRDTQTDGRLIAVDVKTGTLAWEAKRAAGHTSWGSPCVWDAAGGRQVVVPGAKNLKAYDVATGAEKWTVSGLCAVPCTTPVVADGKLIFAGWSPGGPDFKMPTFDEILEQAGDKDKGHLTREGAGKTFLKDLFDSNDTDKNGKISRAEWDEQVNYMKSGKNVAVAVTPGGSGDVTATHVAWRVEKGLLYVPSPLVYRGQMYTANMHCRVSAFDARTGAEVYALELVGLAGVYASPVAANGHVYLFGLDRSVVVLEAGDSPTKVWAAKLDDRIAATPAIAGDSLYVRTGKSLFAFGSK
jgi:outer membrane protein assembly factor BamB